MTSSTLTARRRRTPVAALLLAAVALLAALAAAAAPADAARRRPRARRPAIVYSYDVSVEGRAHYKTEALIQGGDGELRQYQDASFGWTARLGTAKISTARDLLRPVSGPVTLRNVATTQTQEGSTPEPIYCSGTSGEAGKSTLKMADLLAPDRWLDLQLDPFESFRLPFTCSKLGDFGGNVFLVHPRVGEGYEDGIYDVEIDLPVEEMGMGQIIQRFDRTVEGCPAYAQQFTQRCSMELHGQVELRLVSRRATRRRGAARRRR